MLPLEYPPDIAHRLYPYLVRERPSPGVAAFAEDIAGRHRRQAVATVFGLTRSVWEHCRRAYRPDGFPRTPEETLRRGEGACRDVAVLFIDACRALEIPARFVSGYSLAEVIDGEREMHAWAEVFLPGAGWKGFDPSQGCIVSSGHIAVAASARPDCAAPVQGDFLGALGTSCAMSYTIGVTPIDAAV